MDRLASLNTAQREAARHRSGPLLILAGAGTGKTRVITHRMAELIHGGVRPGSILSVTFTNKAAREMHERMMAMLGKRTKDRPLISTFHSLCVRILRQEITVLGYPTNFAIYDRGDQESAARTALREIKVGEKSMRPGDLLTVISRWKNAGVTPDHATDYVENDLEFLAAVAFRKYQGLLKSKGAVDFDDLLGLTNQLFRSFPSVLERQQARFQFVQIDEYQDTNGSQFELIEALVRPHRNLCVVGDDDQSIYGWRGAEVTHILNFRNVFPEAQIVRLEENYRCTDRILDVANRLVRHNLGRHDKQLRATKSSQHAVRYLEFETEQEEAECVVGEIAELQQNAGVPLRDFAILFRTNEQPRLFETELRRRQLRYVLTGGQSFFDRREIRDMLAYLKAIARPNDEMSLLRIINTPARGIGQGTVEKILALAVRTGSTFWGAAQSAASAGEIPSKAATAIAEFRSQLDRFRTRFEQDPGRLEALMRDLIDSIRYEDEIQKQYKTPDQQLLRTSMLDQFCESLKEYCQRVRSPSLEGFLEETALTGRDEETDTDELANEDAVKLMTLHSAKGLEFPRVYMVGLEEGLLPHHRSLELSGTAIEEERRLAYVGITRAQDSLTITRAESRMKWGKRRPSIPSRFLFEMRDESAEDESDDADELSALSHHQTDDAG